MVHCNNGQLRIYIDDIVIASTTQMASEDGNSTSPPDPMIQSTHSLGSVDVGHMISSYSSASASWPFNPSAGKDFVNVAALSFLSSLTICCPNATLEWEVYKHPFQIKLGAATLHAITDGRLCSRGKNDIYSIVEVKPYLFQNFPDTTLMQMGIEMLTWIADCEQGTGSPKKRYFLFSQHREEIFLTTAIIDNAYRQYLFDENNVGLSDTDDISGFLRLNCFGPFNIFKHRHMAILGRIMLALTSK